MICDKMEKLRNCTKCLETWRYFCVYLSVLVLVSYTAADPVRIRVRERLHEQENIPEAAVQNLESDSKSSTAPPAADRRNENPPAAPSSSSTTTIDTQQQQMQTTTTTAPPPPPAAPSDVTEQSKLTTTTPSGECDLCASLSLSKQQLDFVHIEMAKQQILAKLRMTEPPNITGPLPPLPHSLMRQGGTFSQNAEAGTEEFYAKTEQVIFLVNSVTACSDDPKAVCFSLPIKKQISTEEIKSIKFHVYRKGHPDTPEVDTLELFEQSDDEDTFLTKEVVSGERHWLPFKIPRRLMSLSRTNEDASTNETNSDEDSILTKHLKLKCNQCENIQAFLESTTHKAYLEVKTSEPKARSRRTAVECQPGLDQCCKVRLYVSFESMGWDGWIRSPSGYWANYCAGSCRGRHELPAHQHARIMMGLSDEQQRAANNHYHPCCSPTELSELSLLYMESDGQYVKKNLPNMTVETCGCA